MGSRTEGREYTWRLLQQFRQGRLLAWTMIAVVEMRRLLERKKINVHEETTHSKSIQWNEKYIYIVKAECKLLVRIYKQSQHNPRNRDRGPGENFSPRRPLVFRSFPDCLFRRLIVYVNQGNLLLRIIKAALSLKSFNDHANNGHIFEQRPLTWKSFPSIPVSPSRL